MFKKKLSVVMLASLGLFGCDWNDSDKKAVEEAVKESVTEEVVKPEGINVQVELYNQIPELLTENQELKVDFAFDIDNSGKIENSRDFMIVARFRNGKSNIFFEAMSSSISEKNAEFRTRKFVEQLGTAKIETIDGKSIVSINILPQPILATEKVNETDILVGSEKDDPVLNEYLARMAAAKQAPAMNTGVFFRDSTPDNYLESGDTLTDLNDFTEVVQLNSNSIHDSKDDYTGSLNYADIERVSFSFD
ncbi:hypothetical protein KDD30_06560 [Photobacterium sp. GJ3]|uniref:hypothetical protein n=1 Tax=Photobacterium sp. GJ3 TaxID=2829502 RepID=UPI001B8BC89E|nr:hypothetical protein [Photobacterium sp. GJ3]QUJ68754.1 hypothetical protein KDD30_06560 [Photobacterium sp. GJ3]